MKVKNRRLLAIPIIWTIISTALHTIPGSSLPKDDWLSKIWVDKWIHIFIFFLLVFLWCRGLTKSVGPDKIERRNHYQIAAICLSYGIMMELVQHFFISNRSFDIKDILADTVGCSLGIWYSGRAIKK